MHDANDIDRWNAALDDFRAATAALRNAWEYIEDGESTGYPDCLPSFDEFSALVDEWARVGQREPVGPRPTGLWVSEFGPGYRIPAEILALVASGEVEDMSWHNDTCPSFGKLLEDEADTMQISARLWVEHPRDDQREYLGGTRFAINLTLWCGAAPAWCLTDDQIETDDVNEAVTTLRRTIEWARVAMETFS